MATSFPFAYISMESDMGENRNDSKSVIFF